ncbi:fumarylacetoacetate hydrolase [Mycobacterium sp. 852013-50091_SCH5140682]|nr:fumarylacetoacetate hydrolase family protein [Mycobacterium sp. 852013-50091_SCH5140682]OBC04735.1 fumarylacetoacetate hydrolase [Mycobacterium sp. 852013-50091_SCH5140682]
MRLANAAGRLVIVTSDTTMIDVETCSDGRFSADPQAIYSCWDSFVEWARTYRCDEGPAVTFDALRAPVPAPRQIFAIGLNYRDHAAESGFDIPTAPVVFTKYISSFTGPSGTITLSGREVDWEVELVVAIGRLGSRVPESSAWDYVAGMTVGQDISDRCEQFAAPPAQFGLAKSYRGYTPLGPWLVTPDEFSDPDDIGLGCSLNGQTVQQGRTSDMVFGIPELIARLSSIVTLYPGDLIFTGTPAGVGMAQQPPRYLSPGDRLTSWVCGIGHMTHHFCGAKESGNV